MAIRRVGNTRLPDHESNIWNISAPNTILPGDVLSGAPGFGGQSLREAPGPVITETAMVTRILDEEPKIEAEKPLQEAKKPSIKGKRPTIKAVLPPDTDMTIACPSNEAKERTFINMRIPTRLLEHYRAGGRGYQTRIVAVLTMFVENGGEFIEV